MYCFQVKMSGFLSWFIPVVFQLTDPFLMCIF